MTSASSRSTRSSRRQSDEDVDDERDPDERVGDEDERRRRQLFLAGRSSTGTTVESCGAWRGCRGRCAATGASPRRARRSTSTDRKLLSKRCSDARQSSSARYASLELRAAAFEPHAQRQQRDVKQR